MADEQAVDYARQFTAYLDNTESSRATSEKCRDYRDGHQWTTEQASKVTARGQAPIVSNRVAGKVDYLVGVERSNRTDPKAYGRTPEHNEDAEAITDALRYVADNTHLDEAFSECGEELWVEGTCCISVDVREQTGQMEVVPDQVHWDRFYYDPHSRERDFSDARYMGVTAWMDASEVDRLFPGTGEDVTRMIAEGPGDDATFRDRPGMFVDSARKRVRVNRHCFIDDAGVWNVVYFSGNVIVKDAAPSPLIDSDTGEPECPIIAQSLYVDRENRRYGIVQRFLDPQDEINHRRSKALWMLSNIRAWQTNEGVIPDPHDFLEQLSSGKGVATAAGAIGVDWGLLDNGQLANGQIAMMQDAKNEIDNLGSNASLSGKQPQALSGVALDLEQRGGLTELGIAFDTLRHFKLRVYRAIWSRVKQFWTEERWIRVTDDEKNAKFVGVNQVVTKGDLLLRELQRRQEQGLPVQPVDVSDPALLEQAGVEREVSKIDVDIIVSDAPEQVNDQQGQFDVLAKMYMANPNGIPWEAVIEASSLRESVKERMLQPPEDPNAQKRQQMAEAAAVGELERQGADTELVRAKTMRERVNAAAEFQEADGGEAGPMEAANVKKAQAEAAQAQIEALNAAMTLKAGGIPARSSI